MATDLTNSPRTIARLGGFPLLNSSPVRWRISEGVQPTIETFDMIPGDAARLLDERRPILLELISNDRVVQVKDLFVLYAAPSPNPGIARVTVADRRYWWKYDHVGPKRYNIRRKTGVRRISDWGTAALDVSVPDFAFAPFSTRNNLGSVSDRWSAQDATLDVLAELNAAERAAFGTSFGIPIILGEAFGNRSLLEDLEIDDKGDAAMQRMLKATPGLSMYLNLDGRVVLFNKADGGEAGAVAKLGSPMTSGGLLRFIRNTAIRPREIHVLFTREIEVRFDYTESVVGGTTASPAKDARFMENVLPVPDVFLSVGGVKTPQGTYITIDQAITAFGAPPLIGRATLDHNWIQMAMVPSNDSWGPIGLTGTLDFNSDWPPRLQAIQTHYRQTYRINRRWMDRIFQIRAFSVGTIDQTTGQRSPARAYSDHSYMPAKKHLFKRIGEIRAAGGGAGALALFVNVTGYPPSGLIDGSETPSPATVSIPDPDQGILHVDYVVDPLRRVEKVLPSKMDTTNYNMPTADLTQKSQPITTDSVVKGGRRPKLAAQHKIAIVVTAIPASPNTDQQLHRIVVKPSDVASLLPRGAALDGRGPIMEIRVPAGVETARIPWVDSIAAQIEQAFGIRPGVPNFGEYCINEKKGEDGSASLNAIALAEAASAYASFVDRFEGSADGLLNAEIAPAGWLAEVVHEITPQGVGKTTVSLPSEIPALTLWAFLDKGTRAVLMRSVEKAA